MNALLRLIFALLTMTFLVTSPFALALEAPKISPAKKHTLMLNAGGQSIKAEVAADDAKIGRAHV